MLVLNTCKLSQTRTTSDFLRMPWKDVVTMAADVARNGFNVTSDLGKCSVM